MDLAIRPDEGRAPAQSYSSADRRAVAIAPDRGGKRTYVVALEGARSAEGLAGYQKLLGSVEVYR